MRTVLSVPVVFLPFLLSAGWDRLQSFRDREWRSINDFQSATSALRRATGR